MTENFICEVGDWVNYGNTYKGIITDINSYSMVLHYTPDKSVFIDCSEGFDERLFTFISKSMYNNTELDYLSYLENQLISNGVLHFHRTKKMFDKYRDEFGTLFSLSREFEKRSLVDLDMTFATLIENYVIETKTYIKKLTELNSLLNKD